MSIQSFAQNFDPRNPLVDPATGIPTTNYGRALLLALWNRTGLGTGIVPKVTGADPSGPPGLLVAEGTTQADALAVTSDWNWFGTVAIGTGAIIPPLKPGNDIQFQNGGAHSLNIYPPIGYQIDALAVNAPFVLAAGKLRIFECWSLTQLFSFGN